MTDAIIFDVDGTLIDSTYVHAAAWQRAFRAHGVEVSAVRCHRGIGRGGDKYPEYAAGEHVERRLGDVLREQWGVEYRGLLSDVRPLPGAAEAVRELAGRGYAIALATSGEAEFTEKALDMLGIRDVVAAVVSTSDVEESKPEPDLIAEAVRRLAADRAVMVGDTTWDVAAAERAGVSCIAVRTGGFSDAELAAAGAVLTVDSVADLPNVGLDELLRRPGTAQ